MGFNLSAQPPSKWYNKFGGSGIDIGYGVKETYERHYIVAGSTSSFGYGATDAYLILVDSMGQKVWDKTYGGVMADVAKAVVVNPVDSGFIFTGYTGSIGNGGYDVFLARTDKNGNLIWQKSFGGLDWDFGNDIVMGPDGNVVICGYTYNSKYGKKDGYILKVNSGTGALMWEKKYGGVEDDEFRAVKVTNDNFIIFTGETKSYADITGDIYFFKTNATGDSVLCKQLGRINTEDFGNDIVAPSLTEYVIVGGTDSYSSGMMDAFIYKITNVGDSIWLRNYGKPNVDEACTKIALATSQAGSYTIVYGSIDFPFYKLDTRILLLESGGYYQNGGGIGSFEDEEFNSVITASDKGFLAVGYTKSYGSINEDLYIMKMDSIINISASNSLIGTEEKTIEFKDLVVYPTFVSEEKSDVTILSSKEFNYRVYNLYSHEVLFSGIVKAGQENITLSFELLPSGIYFLQLNCNGRSQTSKIIKR